MVFRFPFRRRFFCCVINNESSRRILNYHQAMSFIARFNSNGKSINIIFPIFICVVLLFCRQWRHYRHDLSHGKWKSVFFFNSTFTSAFSCACFCIIYRIALAKSNQIYLFKDWFLRSLNFHIYACVLVRRKNHGGKTISPFAHHRLNIVCTNIFAQTSAEVCFTIRFFYVFTQHFSMCAHRANFAHRKMKMIVVLPETDVLSGLENPFVVHVTHASFLHSIILVFVSKWCRTEREWFFSFSFHSFVR